MLISTVSNTSGGAQQALQQQHLTTRAGNDQSSVFRSVRYLRLATGGAAEEFQIEAGARLRTVFKRFDYNALNVSETALRASLSSRSGGVLVTLDAPRRVATITLSLGKSAAGQTLEIYRMDGDTPASEPTVSASRVKFVSVLEQNLNTGGQAALAEGIGAAHALLFAEETDTPMLLTDRPEGGMEGSGADLRARTSEARADAGEAAGFAMMMSAPGTEGTSTSLAMVSGPSGGFSDSGLTIIDGAQGGIVVADAAAQKGPFPIDFTDRRFLLRLKNSSGTAVSLAPAHIADLSVRSYPSNPRLGLSFPTPPTASAADPNAALFFWRADGEVGNGSPVSAGSVDAGAELEKEISRGLKRFVSLLRDLADQEPGAPMLPATVDVAVVVESDAPCVFEPVVSSGQSALRLEYHLGRESFSDGEEKKVLRFESGRVTSHEISVPVPASTNLVSASMVLDLSVRPEGSGAASASALATPHAVRVDDSRWAAQPIELGAAMTLSSIGLAVAAATPECDLIYELRADSSGGPEGAVIAQGTLRLEAAGHRQWALARLARPVVVSTAKHWLILGTSSGGAIWLAEEGGAGIQMLRRGQDGRVADSSRVAGVRALHSLLTSAGEATLNAPLRMAIGEHTVDLNDMTGTKSAIDLTSAAAAYLGAGSATSLPIRIEAAGPGSVSVYPPRIVYDLVGG